MGIDNKVLFILVLTVVSIVLATVSIVLISLVRVAWHRCSFNRRNGELSRWCQFAVGQRARLRVLPTRF